MKTIEFEMPASAKVEISHIAENFANLNSDDQAIFIQELFDALEYKCKSKEKFESQLCWIGTSIQRYDFTKLNYVFESMNYFLNKKQQEGEL